MARGLGKKTTGGFREDLGKLLLRLVLASLLLFHGSQKLAQGVAPIKGMIAAHGLPGFLGYAVLIGEVIAPVLLILGIFVRLAGLLVVANMTVAVLLAHTGDFFKLTPHGGWALELQAFYFFTGLALCLLGAGRFSAGGAHGRWN